MELVLVGAGLAYVGLGIVLGAVVVVGGLRSALFPTGWLFPALLIVSGVLMAARRRFDIVATLWAAFTLAVFMLGVLVYVNALDRGLDDAAAFDASIIAAASRTGWRRTRAACSSPRCRAAKASRRSRGGPRASASRRWRCWRCRWQHRWPCGGGAP